MLANLFAVLERRFGDPYGGMSRRDLIKATLAASAGLLLSDSGVARANQRDGKRIIIIGGGLGGLSTGYELKSVGYDVTIIEPRDWLGGRVRTTDRLVRDKAIETGGELIGLNHPAWIAYARQFGVSLLEVPHDREAEAAIVLGGKKLSNPDARALWKELAQALSRFNNDAERVEAYEPWKSANARDLDRRTTAQWIESLGLSDRCRQALIAQLTAINGVIPAWQSYLANLAMIKGGGVEKYWTQTDTQRADGGNQQLPEEMADEIGAARFVLHESATAVKIDDSKVTVTVSGGRTFEADDIVLAVPPSVWNRIAFDPPLPVDLNPQMGTNSKFLAVVKTRFWEQDQLSDQSLGDELVNFTYEATSNYPEEGGVCLTAFAGGPSSDQALPWHPADREMKYLDAMSLVFPKIREHFVQGRFVDWHSDRYARGSYSFPAPGQVLAFGPTLEAGLGRLHFAGEHCCPAFVGYMEGALQSGVRLAKRLAKRDGLIKT